MGDLPAARIVALADLEFAAKSDYDRDHNWQK
jgi:hypothetical protein